MKKVLIVVEGDPLTEIVVQLRRNYTMKIN